MPEKARILLVDDDPTVRKMMGLLVASAGWEALSAASGAEALELARTGRPDAACLDLGLPDMGGLEVLARLRALLPALPVFILSGDTELASAVKAIQAGAANYFTKPISTEQVQAALRGALEQGRLLAEVQDLKARGGGAADLMHLMGPSTAIKDLEEQLRQVAATGYTVLLHGETGAGKEVVARALHELSPRAGRAFVALDCGAIPETLLESELFGVEKGAYTGAERKRDGHFQLAQGGTLFLDEIANLPLGLQAKLLRVLQERKLQPLGGGRSVDLDVRVVAASNHDLEEEARQGRFREDLYFRLAEFLVEIPPLRERREDIAPLAARFLDEAAVELRRPLTGFSEQALQALRQHPWPGNVRELRNVVRQAVLLAKGGQVEAGVLTPLLKRRGRAAALAEPGSVTGLTLKQAAEAAASRAEQEAIRAALADSRGNILRAAKALKADNKTLHVKLKKYGIRARDYEPE